jgi:hypothetical protein
MTGVWNIGPVNALREPLDWSTPTEVTVQTSSGESLFMQSDEYIAAVFAVMAATPQHRYVVSANDLADDWFRWRDEQMQRFGTKVFSDRTSGRWLEWRLSQWPGTIPRGLEFCDTWPLPNVAIGVTISDQKSASELIPALIELPARWRVIDAKLTESVDMRQWLDPSNDHDAGLNPVGRIHLVTVGADTGRGPEPRGIDLIRDLASQVLNAQTREFGWEHYDLSGISPPEFISGPALSIPEADVCTDCGGSTSDGAGRGCYGCTWGQAVNLWGTAGEMVTGHPAIYIPCRGTMSWNQRPEDWFPMETRI